MDINEILETDTYLGLMNEYGEKESSFTVQDLISEIEEVLAKEELKFLFTYLINKY